MTRKNEVTVLLTSLLPPQRFEKPSASKVEAYLVTTVGVVGVVITIAIAVALATGIL